MPLEKLPPDQLARLDALLSENPPSARELGIEVTHDSPVADTPPTKTVPVVTSTSLIPHEHLTKATVAEAVVGHDLIPASRCSTEKSKTYSRGEINTPTIWRRFASWLTE